MTAGAGLSEPAYSAFLSYSRQDAARAHAIHESLERYRLPNKLQPRTNAWNRHRLKPLFRDLDEMTVAPDISAALREAIASSAFLIVLCSPQSAQSDWVGREIEMFRDRHGDATILAALIDGTPATAFHPALLHNVGGALLQPLAADFRPDGDGPRLARLKLVAVMAGVGLGEIVQRDTQRRMRQIGSAVMLVLAVVAIVALLIVAAQRSRDDAALQSARAGAMSGYMLDDLRTKLKRYGTRGMLAEVNQGIMEGFRGRDLAGLSDSELQQLAKLRLALGDDAQERGDLGEAQSQITEARRITAARLAAAPDDPQRIFDHAQSQYYVGLIDWRAGNRSSAAAGFDGYRSLAERLIEIDAKNPRWWREVGYAENNLGVYALRSTLDTVEAERHFRSGLAALETAAKLAPRNRDDNDATTDAYGWLGDTLRVRGDFAGAAAIRTTQRQMLTAMLAADPRDRRIKGYFVANDLAMARIADAQGRHQEALEILARGRGAAAELAREEPDNLKRASQVRIFDLFKLRTWLAMPASERPSAATMAAANGDCSADRKKLKSEELADFCEILEVRRKGLKIPAVNSKELNILTGRWGLDLANERLLGQSTEQKEAGS